MNKPLKRNANLILLSRDHHDGLLIGWKLRQGLALNRPLQVLADFITHQFKDHLAPHFADEEQWLFTTLDANDPLRKQAEEEHAAIRQLVAALHSSSDKIIIEDFISKLDQHIRFEERVLFPHIEQKAGAEALASIGAELAKSHDHKSPDTWTNTFWLKDKNL
jgi:hemerythrin-like domain-containing protein